MTTARYRAIIALALLSTLASTAYSVGQAKAPVQPPQPAPSSSPSPTPGVAPSVFFRPIEYATADQQQLLMRAQQKMADVVAGSCFGDFLLSRLMIQTNGLTNPQVLAKLRAVALAVPVDVYRVPWWKVWSSVVGYRNPGESRIHIRDEALAGSICDISSLSAHEILGHLGGGFEHDFYPSPSRPFSVPYSINAAFTECCKP